MINQDVHGSGDRHRSFPGGIFFQKHGVVILKIVLIRLRRFFFCVSKFRKHISDSMFIQFIQTEWIYLNGFLICSLE